MAFAVVNFKNPHNGQMREAPVGFSWTLLIFGCFLAMFRSDWKWAVIMFIIAILTGGLSWLFFPFVYNKIYIKELIKQGYKVVSVVGSDENTVGVKVGFALPRF
jgi:hypothetical protein